MVVVPKPFSFQERLVEIDMFFQGTDPVHQTMNRVAQDLERAGIPYALAGGMAVNAHRHRRTTDDVDFLLTPLGFREFCARLAPGKYERQSNRGRRFKDSASGVTFDILLTGKYPGDGNPGPIAFPDPAQVSEIIENVRVLDLPTLVQLKLAARRYYDFGDVVHLIAIHGLDEKFMEKLHPAVHQNFIECLEEKRREDAYLARQNDAGDAPTADE